MKVTIEAGTPAGNDDRFCKWLEGYDVDPKLTYRVDVCGNGQMWVYQYALNDEDAKYVDEDGDVALREPFEVRVESFPVLRTVAALEGFTSITALRLTVPERGDPAVYGHQVVGGDA